ncbi:hypothetical protein [Zhihengliuella flava]|uniref:Lipoprotein n=1 Tax=Zhihengliuella flava TaxID=1285193 RepID=A0A931DBE5_9MICC|nr:hypothetical protein [Zhihengliuella flava]MBG6085794.1 hypothetical protein [Zhihengliuella flava]
MKKLLAPAAALILLTGCASPTSEDATMDACDTFAYYLEDAESPEQMDRATTVEQIGVELEGKPAPDARITDAVDVMERTVDGSESAWVMGADMMAAACMDLGWES